MRQRKLFNEKGLAASWCCEYSSSCSDRGLHSTDGCCLHFTNINESNLFISLTLLAGLLCLVHCLGVCVCLYVCYVLVSSSKNARTRVALQIIDDFSGKCPVCFFVFCMECNKASHGNSLCEDHGKLRTDTEEVDEGKPVEESAIMNRDFEIFQGMVKRIGTTKTQDYLNKIILQIFGHLDEVEKRELATKYIEASPDEKEKYYEEYGRAYLEYFLSGLRGTKRRTHFSVTRFADFMNSLKDEKRGDSSEQMNKLLKQLQISAFGHGLGLQPCPACSVPIEKDGGCHHMNCTNCGVHFCWDCLQTMEACTATRCGEVEIPGYRVLNGRWHRE